MYNIKLNEGYFVTYAEIGSVEGGINIPTLPPLDDNDKSKFYYYDFQNKLWALDESKYYDWLNNQNNTTSEKTIEEKFDDLSETMIDLTTFIVSFL